MAQLYCSGPVDVWVGTGGGQSSKTPVFLGHGERAPQVREVHNWNDVICNLGGSQEPFDKLYGRGHVEWSVDLIRLNMPVLLSLLPRPNPFTGARGATPPLGVGTLALTENMTFPVWLRWPYSTKAAYAGMPNGMRMLANLLTGPDEYELNLDTAFKVNVSGYGLSVFDPGGGGFNCYDGDMSLLGAIN